MKDTVSRYIPVPCGHCAECVRLRSTGVLQRVQLEAQFGWPFFCTLTYNDQAMPRLTCSDGVSIRYADISDVQNMIKRLRSSDAFGRRFRYFGVSELGSQKGRPHFHLIFSSNISPMTMISLLITLRVSYLTLFSMNGVGT